MRILIAENHPDTRNWLESQLRARGHAVATTASFAGAAEILKVSRWDVVICNIGLSDGSGWDLLVQTSASAGALRIAMSGLGINADAERSRAKGFDYHLYKPFPLAYLERLLEEAPAARSFKADPGEWSSRGPAPFRFGGAGAPLERESA